MEEDAERNTAEREPANADDELFEPGTSGQLHSDGDDAEEGEWVVVGFVFTDKKRRSLLTPDFVSRARARRLRFVPVDHLRPIEEQEGHPFDIILHKLPSTSPLIRDWELKLQSYRKINPWVTIVDTPQAARQLSNRATMLQAVEGLTIQKSGYMVSVPRQVLVSGGLAEIKAAITDSNLQYPLLAKPLLADGSEASHALALVHDEGGLRRLVHGELPELTPPCMLQEFVDHGGSLFKVYVVGETVSATRRKSLPDLHRAKGSANGANVAAGANGANGAGSPGGANGAGRAGLDGEGGVGSAERATGLEFVERISCHGKKWREELERRSSGVSPPAAGMVRSCSGDSSGLSGLISLADDEFLFGSRDVEEPPLSFVRSLAMALKSSLQLELFNFDLIRVAGAHNRFHVVDINYFPGIAKMPGYEGVFVDFLRSSVERTRLGLRGAMAAAAISGIDLEEECPSPTTALPGAALPAVAGGLVACGGQDALS